VVTSRVTNREAISKDHLITNSSTSSNTTDKTATKVATNSLNSPIHLRIEAIKTPRALTKTTLPKTVNSHLKATALTPHKTISKDPRKATVLTHRLQAKHHHTVTWQAHPTHHTQVSAALHPQPTPGDPKVKINLHPAKLVTESEASVVL
jgi:hypothetical protein